MSVIRSRPPSPYEPGSLAPSITISPGSRDSRAANGPTTLALGNQDWHLTGRSPGGLLRLVEIKIALGYLKSRKSRLTVQQKVE
jgi:hypothetical protein